MGVAAAELRGWSGDPVQQPAGVVESGVGAHEVEHGSGVFDEVVGQSDGGGEGVGADGLVPAVAQVAGEVQEASEAAGGARELGGPAGQMGESPSGGQPRLQVALGYSSFPADGSRVSTAGSSLDEMVRLAARA